MAVSPVYDPILVTQRFQDWLDRTNALSSDMNTKVLTTDATIAGASVTGNSSLKGNFDCFTLSVGTGIRGGTNSLSQPLNVLSNANLSADLNVAGLTTFNGPSVTTSASTTLNVNGTTNIYGAALNVTAPTVFTSTVTAPFLNAVATEAVKLETPRNITLNGVVSGTATFDGSADITITTTQTAPGGLIPVGGIIMWSGSTVPAGWALCDGTNGTPNLRDRFIVSSGGKYAIGATGGVEQVTLTPNQIPGHAHTFSGTTSTAGAHAHSLIVRGGSSDDGGTSSFATGVGTGTPQLMNEVSKTTDVSGHTHTVSGTTSSFGSGAAHENLPPYYALAFIMKL